MLDWFKRGASPASNAGIFELYDVISIAISLNP
jgi:hypothetical protein